MFMLGIERGNTEHYEDYSLKREKSDDPWILLYFFTLRLFKLACSLCSTVSAHNDNRDISKLASRGPGLQQPAVPM